MKIGVLAYTGDSPAFETGVTAYQRVLFRMFGEYFKDINFYIYLSPNNAKRYDDLTYDNIKYYVIQPPLLKGKIMRIRFLRSIIILLAFGTHLQKTHNLCQILKDLYGINLPYENHFDILFYTSYGYKSYSSLFIKTTHKIPLISIIHDLRHILFSNNSIYNVLDDLYTRVLVKNSDLVVVPSEFLKKICITHYRHQVNRIAVLYSIPDLFMNIPKTELSNFQSIRHKYNLPERPFIFYPSTIVATKNHLRLIEALKIIKEKTGPINLVLCGSISDRTLYQTILKKVEIYGLSKHFFHLGFIADQDKYELYKFAKALVMPSINESFGLPIWEAFSLGCPVVASDTQDLKEQVRDAALLCNPYDYVDIAEKISLIVSDDKLRKLLIDKAYMIIKEHSLENYAKKWNDILSGFLR